MYYCDKGIVLRHRDINEADRLVTIFTKDRGRIEVNFKSVRKSDAKLRGISELFTYGDYRFYSKKHGSVPLCVGGSIISSHPQIRDSFEKLIILSFLSDAVIALTPLYQKSEEKFNLLISALDYLCEKKFVSKWFVPVFIMNLLEYYGTGFKNTNLGYDSEFWSLVHGDFNNMEKISKYEDLYYDAINLALAKLSEHSGKNFSVPDFYNNIEKVA